MKSSSLRQIAASVSITSKGLHAILADQIALRPSIRYEIVIDFADLPRRPRPSARGPNRRERAEAKQSGQPRFEGHTFDRSCKRFRVAWRNQQSCFSVDDSFAAS